MNGNKSYLPTESSGAAFSEEVMSRHCIPYMGIHIRESTSHLQGVKGGKEDASFCKSPFCFGKGQRLPLHLDCFEINSPYILGKVFWFLSVSLITEVIFQIFNSPWEKQRIFGWVGEGFQLSRKTFLKLELNCIKKTVRVGRITTWNPVQPRG